MKPLKSSGDAPLSTRIPKDLKARLVKASKSHKPFTISMTQLITKGIEMVCDELEKKS